MRKIHATEGMKIKASRSANKEVQVYSFFPADKGNCECRKMISDWKDRLALLSEKGRREAVLRQEVLICPRDRIGMSRYRINCNSCGEMMGYCWSRDKTLTDWCDLHYTSWVKEHEIEVEIKVGNKKKKKIDHEYLWHGCFGHHISPITEQLCWECACGVDTRDFRANMTLPSHKAHEIEEKNKIGREYDKPDSKFKVSKVNDNVIPFSED